MISRGLLLGCALLGFRLAFGDAGPVDCPADTDPGAALDAIAAAAHEAKLAENPSLRLLAGERVTAFPRITRAATDAQARFAESQLDALACIDIDRLDPQRRLTAAVLEHELRMDVAFAPHHDLRFDLTPYRLGLVAGSVLPAALGAAPLASESDRAAYLALLDDLARYLEEIGVNLDAQVARDIRLPRAAIPGARVLVAALEQQVPALATVAPARVESLDEETRTALAAAVEARLATRIRPALAGLASVLDEDYEQAAPPRLGLGGLPGGEAYYRFLVREETTLELDPETIHRQGLALVEALERAKESLRRQLGHEGDRASFNERMRNDPRFYDATPEDLVARYRRYVTALEARLDEQFSRVPEAGYDLLRLDPAAERGLTFGYYQPPLSPGGTGYFRFNGSSLEERPALWAGAVIFHELVPGHHFQIALTQENEGLSPYRKSLFFAAFAEGWANYAARLAQEMGLLDDPWDAYGWLLMDSFASARLVVDTGLNHIGWSREQAADYFRAHTFATESEIDTELLRYGSALPGQALSYKLGDVHFTALRDRVRDAQGEDWDPRRFHEVVLGAGMLPLPVLTQLVEGSFDLDAATR